MIRDQGMIIDSSDEGKMQRLTIRLPDDTAQRLKALAKSRGLNVSQLLEEFSLQAIAAFDAETRFCAMAAAGNTEQALAILDRLDAGEPLGVGSSN